MNSRQELIATMPKHAVVAEVGVWKGDFSKEILHIAQPKTLVLVDMWRHFNDPTDPRLRKFSQRSMDKMFISVVHRFREHPEVAVLRTSSLKAAQKFPNATFDWIYLDACHGYEEVLKDLNAWFPLIKPQGYLTGHDYNHRCGVKKAVDEFVASNPHCTFLYCTHEGTSSFVLRRDA